MRKVELRQDVYIVARSTWLIAKFMGSNLKNHTPICPEYLFNELHDGQDPLSKDVNDGNLVLK